MADLKPCPFCGRIPDIEDCGEHRWFIRCKCGTAQDKLFFQKCDAVKAWNKRKELRVKDIHVPVKDCISRQAAIDALGERPVVWLDNDDYTLGERNQYDMDRLAIETVPSAEPKREWHHVDKPPTHHRDVLVRGIEAIGNVTVHKVMQWDVDTWRPTDYAPSISWKEWSEIDG